MKQAKKNTLIFAALILAALLRFLLIPATPLYQDEAVYAEIITELLHNPLQFIPHYLGEPIAWKPPAGFYSYAGVVAVLNAVLPQLPLGYTFRAAPALFTAISIFTLYFFLRELFTEREAFYASICFALANQTLITTNALLLDSALMFFILLALLAYVKALKSRGWLLPAALFSFLATLTKTYVAFIIPISAFALYYYIDKRELKERWFLLSLLSVPLAMLLYAIAFSFAVPGGLREITSSYLYDAIGRMSSQNLVQQINANSADLFKQMFPWSLLAIAGAAFINLRRAEDKFACLWAAVSLIPLANSTGYFWYCLPAVPPLSFLVARSLAKLKPAHSLAALLILSIFSLLTCPLFSDALEAPFEQMRIGILLQNKEKVLTLTETGVPTILFYKFSGENAPHYSGVKQMVADPHGLESYTAFKLGDLVFDTYEKNMLSNPTPEYIQTLISSNSPDAVVISHRIYEVYSKHPLENYSVAVISKDESYYLLECTR